MERARLGTSGLEVSRIGLGTWAIGGWMWGGTDREQAIRTIEAALDAGIDLIDTAPVYGQGESEAIVGEALRRSGRRDRVVIATKVGLAWDAERRVRRDASPQRLRVEVEDSLRRLGTDRIDLYQVHWPDPKVPIERTAETMAALHREGKIRAIGVSNFDVAQLDAFRAVAPLHADQPPYNVFERAIEVDVLPWCAEHDVAVLAYGALCRGLLSGRMRPDTHFEGDDLRRTDPKFRPPRYAAYLGAVAALDAYARARWDKPVIALAVRWLLDQPGVSVALWGARRPDQLAALAQVDGWTIDAAGMDAIARIVADHVAEPVGPEFMAPPA
jgi:aryl-alcohol dehydrogenase-like predicted oxidoreductase